jgi:hypothetical protein
VFFASIIDVLAEDRRLATRLAHVDNVRRQPNDCICAGQDQPPDKPDGTHDFFRPGVMSQRRSAVLYSLFVTGAPSLLAVSLS